MGRWCIVQHIFLVFIVCVTRVHTIDFDQICPRMSDRILDGYGPVGKHFCFFLHHNCLFCLFFRKLKVFFARKIPSTGNRSSTEYKEVLHANDIEKCVLQCCLQKLECNVAFMSSGRCYHVRCVSDEQCLPMRRNGMADKWKMVLVRPVSGESPFFFKFSIF